VRGYPPCATAQDHPQNFDIFDFTLSDGQMSRIASLDTGAGLFIDHDDPATVSQMSKVRFRD